MKNKTKFAELNKEQMFKVWQDDLTVIFVDFKVENIIIEFQGTYWHKFPEVKEKDLARLKFLEKYNYKVLLIEQKEYEEKKIETIIKCINFINENYEKRSVNP